MADYKVFKLLTKTIHPWIVRSSAANPNEPDDYPDMFETWEEAMNFAYKWAGFTRIVKQGFIEREEAKRRLMGDPFNG
jgi:hypothetical protein